VRWRDFFHLTRTAHTENAEMDFKKAIVLTPSVIPCRVLAPGAWNLPVRATVSFHLTRTGHTENAEMDFKKAIVDYSNWCEVPGISHRCAEDIDSFSIFNIQFWIFNSPISPRASFHAGCWHPERGISQCVLPCHFI
jgi:hypothetical protein